MQKLFSSKQTSIAIYIIRTSLPLTIALFCLFQWSRSVHSIKAYENLSNAGQKTVQQYIHPRTDHHSCIKRENSVKYSMNKSSRQMRSGFAASTATVCGAWILRRRKLHCTARVRDDRRICSVYVFSSTARASSTAVWLLRVACVFSVRRIHSAIFGYVILILFGSLRLCVLLGHEKNKINLSATGSFFISYTYERVVLFIRAHSPVLYSCSLLVYK